MDPSVYLAIGIAASFVLLATMPRERRIEAFREEERTERSENERSERREVESLRPETIRGEYTISPVTGETIYANPNGILLDQGQQSVRVGSDSVVVYTSAKERLRVFSNGAVGIGVTSPVSGPMLHLSGDVAISGLPILQGREAAFRSYFRSPYGYDYDFGGLAVVDRSPEAGLPIAGDWIQMDLPSAVVLGKYILSPVPGLGHDGKPNVPDRFYLLGSTDRTLWYIVDGRDGQRTAFDGTPGRTTYDVTSNVAFSSYRLVFERIASVPGEDEGAMLELSSWTLVDKDLKIYPPAPMSKNTQTLNGLPYRLSCSKPGNAFSFIGDVYQDAVSSLVGWTANGTTLNPANYFQLDFTPTDTNYARTADQLSWVASGEISTPAYTAPAPYHSGVVLRASYNASAPVECLRAYYDGSARVGVGTARASSNLSVLGTMDCSFASFSEGRSDLAKRGNRLVYATAGPDGAMMNFCSLGTNAYDARIAVTEGRSVSGSGIMRVLAGTVALNDTLFSSTGYVGIGTSSPASAFHVDGGSVLVSNGTGAGSGGMIMFNPSSSPDFSPMAVIGGKWASSAGSAHFGGLGFSVRSASGLTEAMTIEPSGAVSISRNLSAGGISIQGMNLSSGYLDYVGGFTARVGTSTDPLRPAYQSVLSMNASGLVGIGSVSPGQATRGNSTSQGLDIGNAGNADVLRLVNTSNTANGVERTVGMQFVITDASANAYQKLQARIVGSTSDLTNASLGALDFYVKCNDTSPAQTPNTDGSDVSLRASVMPYGIRVGNPSIPAAFSLLVGNSLGGGQFAAAGGDTDFSLDAAAGDAIVRAERGHSLFLQSGPYRSAICLYKDSTNVGVGSTVPRANLDVLGTPFMNGSSPVLTISGSTPSGIGQVPQGTSYLLNATGQNITGIALPASQSFSYQAQSINLQTGSVGYTHSGVAYTSHGARMTINGGKTLTTGSSSEPNRHATIDFFSSGDSSPVVRIGQRATYNTAQSYTFMGYNTTYLSTVSQSVIGYAIYATDNIMVANGASFMAVSDRRLKRNIESLSSSDSLRKIEALEMVSYRMKDPKQPGRQLGVIAQQVQEVIPEAVKEGGDEYVANLLVRVLSVDGCRITLERDVEVPSGASVRLIGRSNRTIDAQVVAVFGPEWRLDREIEEDDWLVFGTKEERVLSVDKDTISMVAVSALQELGRKYRSLERRLEQLERLVR